MANDDLSESSLVEDFESKLAPESHLSSGWEGLLESVNEMERQRQKELQEELERSDKTIFETKDGFASLPSQHPNSVAFQKLLVEQYGKAHQHHVPKIPAKKLFQSKKAKSREARKAKKGEEHQDKLDAKQGRVVKKQRTKNRVKQY